MSDKLDEKALVRAVKRAMENAGTLPAKDAVKLVPADWHRICDLVLDPSLGPGSTGEAEGWRDIKSAPKNGQKVLACWAGRTNNMMIVWYEDWTWHAMIGGWKSVVPDEPPTHWMPLPSPPSAMLAAAGGR